MPTLSRLHHISVILYPDTFTLDQLFTEINSGGLVSGGYPGGVAQASDYQAGGDYSVAHAAVYHWLLTKEAKVSWTYSYSDTALQTLYASANRDPRMGTAYTNLFQWMEECWRHSLQ